MRADNKAEKRRKRSDKRVVTTAAGTKSVGLPMELLGSEKSSPSKCEMSGPTTKINMP